ncbi:MAG: hypothetical protein Q9160_002801 [Pyrenula sp. 1 TL-2023]
MASKVIVMGSINGAIRKAFAMLGKVQTKQNLSFAILLGDLFGESSSEVEDVLALLKGEIAVPLPTYFAIGNAPLPTSVVAKLKASSNELCHNLFFLGRRGTFKTSEGVKIVTLGGSLMQQLPENPEYEPFFTENDARGLHGANNADILLSSEWPLGLNSGSQSARDDIRDEPLPQAQQCISNLCSTLKPRYHFSTSSTFFFEREPFYHTPSDPNNDTRQVTRFLSLSSFKNPSGAKFVYAFNLDPSEPTSLPPTQLPPSTTPSPFTTAPKRLPPHTDQRSTYNRFNGNEHDHHHRPRKRNNNNNFTPAGPSECFFCLSNPLFEKHMVVSIGNESYVTISKGPLPTLTTFPALNGAFPGHMLIIPLSHVSTLANVGDASTHAATFAEMGRFRKAMDQMLLKINAKVPEKHQRLASVTFEVSRNRVRHLGWQWLPVPAEYGAKGLVEAAFRVKAEDFGYEPFVKIGPEEQVPGDVGEYFRVWVPTKPDTDTAMEGMDGGEAGEREQGEWKTKSLYTPLRAEQSFDLQFGRKVMAGLLQVEGRERWDLVRQSVEEETGCAEKFKEAFKEFDFSLEGDGEEGE